MDSPRPNILYLVCHDLGRALGCYGAGIPTPHLDAFAAQGVRFASAHCASPACSPSRACAMSGLYAHTTGAIGLSHMGWPLDLKWQTTVDDFNAAGYQTILSGINHERHPRSDRYEVDLSRDWEDWKLPRAVDNALSALRDRDVNRPFYLNIATQEPHACIWQDVGKRIPALPPDFIPWVPPAMPRTPALEAAFHRFASAVAFLDREFGRLLRGLEELALADNTLVVFTTDHGMAGPRGKGSLYGVGTEIALLMRQPGVLPASAVREAPVSNVHFRATLAEAAGLTPVSACESASFWSLAREGGAPVDHRLYLERNYHGEKPWRTEADYIDCYDPIRAVRTARYLYVRNFRPGAKPAEPTIPANVLPSPHWETWITSWSLPEEPRPEQELYDLARDPLEQCNLAQTPEYAGVLEELDHDLSRWMLDTSDFTLGHPPTRPEGLGWGPRWPA